MADVTSREVNGDLRPANEPGVYRHPETGHELIARRHKKFGDSQADGFVQVGYVWVGPAPKVEKTEKKAAQPAQKEKFPSQMNKTELLQVIADKGLTAPTDATNDQLRAIIKGEA